MTFVGKARTPASSALAGHSPRPCEGAAAEVTPWSTEVCVTIASSPEGVGTTVAAQGVRPATSSDHIVAGASLKGVPCWATADEVAPWASDDEVRTPAAVESVVRARSGDVRIRGLDPQGVVAGTAA